MVVVEAACDGIDPREEAGLTKEESMAFFREFVRE